MESLFVLVTGFGAPHVNVKRYILIHNIARIKSHMWKTLTIRICVYDDTDISDIANQHPEIEVIRQPGIVGDFIKRFAPPDVVRGFDYILMILDDVLLQPNVDFAKIIRRKKTLAFDIISPTKTLDSEHIYDYMLTRPGDDFHIKVTTMCEYFCFFMDPRSFEIYYNEIDATNNPWLWGLDLLLYYKMGLRVGMMNDMTMKHFYARTCYDQHPDKDPYDGLRVTLRKVGINDINEFRGVASELYTIKESLRTL